MEKIYYALIYIVGLIGCWIVLSNFMILPNSKYSKTVKSYVGKTKNSSGTSSLDAMLETFSKRFVKFISLNDIKRSEMAKALYISHNSKTPEEYMAYIYTVTAIVALLGLLLMIISKFIGIGVLVLAGVTYYMNVKKLTTNKNQAVAEIEKELPKYVAFLKQALKNNTNVIAVMERYSTTNEAFSKEMKQALADAKTSSFDSAMARLTQRVSSDRMKMVVHGLMSAYHGDNVLLYFTMLERDFTAFEINDLKKGIKTIPQKMQIPKILIFSSIAFTLFLPLVLQIIDSFKDVFTQL